MDPRYDHLKYEKAAQDLWEQSKTYTAQHNPGPLYSIDTPPPTVSGQLHIGHIFSYTQTDIIARYKRMSGFSVFYPLGFDDNGLPTERYVEKKLDIGAHAVGRSEFIRLCLQETEAVEKTFQELWQRMGLSVDWQLCYSTISDASRKVSQESFIRLYEKGYVYRTYEPALYCTTCRTSVAQAELDDEEKPSFFNDIVFKSQDGKDLLIGTTRPELLSSCVALLYNPGDERYKYLRGQQATVPIFENKVPILEDEGVEIEKGTGLVMCCTFGDKKDIEWYKKFKLPYKQSIGLDGKWLPDTGILAGLRATAARETIINALKEKNLLLRQNPIKHSVNVHERCKKEIEYVALSQWFLRILEHKEKFLALADQINWYPTFMKARYKNWVENISWDWCLSRQRFFGIPFPVWHCLDCKEILLAPIDKLPIDPQETKFTGNCTKCKSSRITPDTDVMDTWNTSSITPQLCYLYFNPAAPSAFTQSAELKKFIPMSMRPQAHDIIRTWAFYTIVKSWMHFETIPWHDIVISGHVLSDAKEKISKSKDNNPLKPDNLLKNYPADVIRYWTASGALGQDVAFSENQLKIGLRLITKIWNAFRFIQEHVAHLESASVESNHLGAPNEWLLHTATECFAHYKKYFEQQEFSLALDQIEKFFWHNFCDNYLEIIKDQLFNPLNYDAREVHATRHTLYTVGLRILQLYAPFLPHITETLYDLVYRKKEKVTSLHQTKFTAYQHTQAYVESAHTMHLMIDLITKVRKLKSEHQLSLKAELDTLEVYAFDLEQLKGLIALEQTLKGITHAKNIVYRDKKIGACYLDTAANAAHIEVEIK